MKNSNDLKTFSPAVFGGGAIATKGGGEVGSTFNGGGTYQSPPFNPNGGTVYGPGTGINPYPNQTSGKGAFQTTIQVIDINGNPLTSAHVKWNDGGTNIGTITDANGEATINVASESTMITISYLGKRTHIAAFKDLVNAMITLQENVNNLPPVVVGTKPATTKPTTTAPTATVDKNKKLLTNIAIGVGAIFLISALGSKGKKGSASKAVGLSGTKSKKRKSAKKGKKRKGLRTPAQEITL